MPADASVFNHYKLFMKDNDIKAIILVETTRYGAANVANWEQIALNDLHCVLALVMLMGIVKTSCAHVLVN